MVTPLSAQFRGFLELIPDPALLVQEDGRIVFANAQAETLLGYGREALQGQSLEVLLPDHIRALHSKHRARYHAAPARRAMGTGLPLHARRLDGTDFPVDVSLSPIASEKGLLTLACIRDMTERALAHESLRKAEERYRLLVETASEVFYRVAFQDDPLRGVLEFVSPQCERITARRPQEFIEDPNLWIASVHPDDRASVFESTQGMLASRAETTRYYRIKNHANGEFRYVADRVVPVVAREGRVVGYQGTARDITERVRADEERKRLEDRVRQAQKMEAVGRLTGEVAHDFNNLLTVILGCCETVLAELGAASSVRRDLESIGDAARRGARLTRQMLAFARQQIAAPRVLDLNAHLRALEELLRRMVPENIGMAFSLEEGLWPVRMDPSQVDQVAVNLATNARDALPDGGSLTIDTANVTLDDQYCVARVGLLPGDYVQLSVKDSGRGMDPETLQHVFEPFFTTKPEEKGTGLGLASVYGIVKQNHGFVYVDSELGRGTSVVVYLPRSSGEEPEPPTPSDTSVPRGHETVLLVDDDAQVRLVTRRLLGHLGYEVLEAPNPSLALTLCETHQGEIHLLLTDVVMPTMNGVALSERAKTLKPNISTLFMSGYAAHVVPHGGLLHEGIHHIEKPFERSALARAVRKALDTRHHSSGQTRAGQSGAESPSG